MIACEINKGLDLTFICDNKRHLICLPYSKPNMLSMATELGINPLWFHKDHYDIPKDRIKEISGKCKIVSPKEIVNIIKSCNNGQFRKHKVKTNGKNKDKK